MDREEECTEILRYKQKYNPFIVQIFCAARITCFKYYKYFIYISEHSPDIKLFYALNLL